MLTSLFVLRTKEFCPECFTLSRTNHNQKFERREITYSLSCA